MKPNAYPWGVFLILLIAAVFGVVASFPFVLSLYADMLAGAPIPLPAVFALALAQNTVILAVTIGVGLLLTAKLGLPGAQLIDDWRAGKPIGDRLRTMIPLAVMTGFSVGITVLLMFALLLRKELSQLPIGKATLIPIWRRLLICLYGGLTEEILMRIFLFSLLVWILNKLWRTVDGAPRRKIFWAANIILAALFGLGHLGSVVPFMPITFKIVLGALLLNGVASIAFTSLYLRRGLEAAMLAHFIADFMIWVIGPLLIAGT
jgi:membrane protease YdiL (CAAX protease family)